MFKKCLICIVLIGFTFVSGGEARQTKALRLNAEGKKQSAVALKRARARAAFTKTRQSRAVAKKRPPSRSAALKARSQRVAGARARSQRVAAARRSPQPRALRNSSATRTAITRRRSSQATLAAKKGSSPQPILIPPPSAPYLSLLNSRGQGNAKLMGFPSLYDKNVWGEGKTVAIIEIPEAWNEMRNVIKGTVGNLPPELRERYKRNFLPPIGGPGTDPNVANELMRKSNMQNPNHGSCVASIPMNLAPHLKVQPVSTHYGVQAGEPSYDVAAAFKTLSLMPNITIASLSNGCFGEELEPLKGAGPDGKVEYLFRYAFPPALLEGIKGMAKAGKGMVFAAGNNTEPAQDSGFRKIVKPCWAARFMGYLAENLDSKTRKSVKFAGAIDPDTLRISPYSNTPGHDERVQKMFLCTPGKNRISYSDLENDGTSNAAPAIAAAAAALVSKPGGRVSVETAFEALDETAEKRPEKHIYGQGIARVGNALEWLEARGF